ncbi:MAG TPA: hypothetical protein VMV31_14605 [Terriglobales bacterium]|nr:hypothetical protein [Terriglobales bacterium]
MNAECRLWRTGMALVRLAAWDLKPLLPRGSLERVARAQRLMLVPYFAHGAPSCIAGALNPVGAVLIAESAAAGLFIGVLGPGLRT